jgi:hypothetical protein
MTTDSRRLPFGTLVALGSVWGLAEAGLGLAIESCARFVSGSIMTGVALFFISAAWVRTKRFAGPAIVTAIALAFKLLDAVWLGLPVKHGAIGNPMFAFVTEAAAFVVIAPLIADAWRGRVAGRAALGGLSALAAVNLFPLVKFATGIPACVAPGTTTPLSLVYAPIAVAVSLVTVPLGFLAAAKLEALEGRLAAAPNAATLRWLAPSFAAVLCLAAQGLIRAL